MSWSPASDDDMANEALIEDHDDEDIMEVKHIRNDIPSGMVASPAQSDSSGRIEASPGRRRSSSPPIELRRSSRRSSHQLSTGPERLAMMSTLKFTDLPAAIQHLQTLLEQLFIRERPTAVDQQ
jgi:hypothetical protein